MEIHLHFDARRYQSVLTFSYFADGKSICHDIDIDSNNPYPGVTLDAEQITALISVLYQALVSSLVREPDYESERGISVPVDTNPTRE